MNVKAVQDLQEKITAVMEELDHKVFRPEQVRTRRRARAVSDRGRRALAGGSSADAPPPFPSAPTETAFLCQRTDMRGPQEEVHRCLEQCGQPIARHEQAVMSELQGFQQRVQRCVVQCQDRQASSKDEAKYEKCISECAVFYQKELAQLRPKLLKKP